MQKNRLRPAAGPGFLLVPAVLAPPPAGALAWQQLYACALERARASLRPSAYEQGLRPLCN
jgi:hypothetical protein